MKMTTTSIRLIVFGCIVVALIAAYEILSRQGIVSLLEDGAALKLWIEQLGTAGPFIVITLMTTAIIISPIPSAPIALAAGAVYGHTAGAVYVATGSELGAIIAFALARWVGADVLHKWLSVRLNKRMIGSQNTLMGIVFVSRLLPFISFDIVSYAAGITPLSFWRFAVATLAGIIPASILLAHFGSELASGENQRIGITVLLLGGVSLIVMLAKWFSMRRDKHIDP